VYLIGIQHRRVGQRQTLAAAEHCCLWRATDAGQHVEDFGAPRRRPAGDTDSERIGDKDLSRSAGPGRHAMSADPLDIRDDPVDVGSRRAAEMRSPIAALSHG
jgi:hypothetical protein